MYTFTAVAREVLREGRWKTWCAATCGAVYCRQHAVLELPYTPYMMRGCAALRGREVHSVTPSPPPPVGDSFLALVVCFVESGHEHLLRGTAVSVGV